MPNKNATFLKNVVVPQVLADMISAQLKDAIRFAPLATMDYTLRGVPGDEITVPKWEYIGPAEEVGEGQPIPIAQLATKDFKMPIHKAGKGVEISDETALSGYGDPVGEGANQITLAITDRVEIDFIDCLATQSIQKITVPSLTVENLGLATEIFDDEDDQPLVLLSTPKDASVLKKDANKNWLSGTEVGANRIVTGVFGEIDGVQVARTRRLNGKNVAFLVKPGALRFIAKRDVMVESDRDIIHKTTVITADQHYGVYLYDPKKVVMITVGGTTEEG